MLFGQVVIGPPGAGKTTYCLGMEMYLQSVGRECGNFIILTYLLTYSLIHSFTYL